MKPKLKTCLLTILLPGIMQAALAQTISRPDTYNYTMGVEALRNNKPEEALEYLNKELEDNPDNGYALVWIAFVRNYHGEYGRALTAADLAVRKIPENDKEYRAFAYVVRAEAYVALGENEKALDDLTSAAVETPDDIEIYGKRADLYCYMGKYDLAEKDYRKVISIAPDNVLGYMGIGLIANVEKRYEDAIELFDYVTGLAPEYSSGYSFRAESYIGLRRYEEAVEDIARALAAGYDDKAFSLILEVPDSAMAPLVEKLRMQSAENPGDGYWPYCLGAVYEAQGAYRTAIACYMDSQKKAPSPVTAYRISNCYSETGDFASALKHIDFAIALDSTDYGYVMAKADLLYEFCNCKSTDIALFTDGSNFTDDTVMTIAVADWLLSGVPLQKTMSDWGLEYPNRGYGGMFLTWLFNSEDKEPYNSFGNGAGMRVSPCGYYAKSLEEALVLARQSAEVTHNHPEGIKGAQSIAAAIFMARQHKSKDEIKDYIERTFGYSLHRTCDEIRPTYQFDVTCQGSCPEAIIAFLDSHDYESAVRLAISLGGDSDTIACMAGGIAAAYYGIPAWMVKYAVSEYLPRNIRDILGRFDEACFILHKMSE